LSLTVVPMLAGRAFQGASGRLPEPAESFMVRAYARALSGAVRRPLLVLLLVVGLGAASVGLFLKAGTGFLPKADEGGFVVDYLTPEGSALSATDRQVRAMERVIAATPEVASYSRRTGSELGLFATAQNSGDILVRLKPRPDRQRS
jgi:multidrug efflux pump subunit AcrB